MSFGQLAWYIGIVLVGLLIIYILTQSIINIGAMEVGLVRKNLGSKKLKTGIIALNGEAGNQAKLLRPGLHFVTPFVYVVERCSLVQVETDEIGVVISQVGAPLSDGNRSGEYKEEFGDYENVEAFISGGGQMGIQRKVLQPGTIAAIHPVAFTVITSNQVFGRPINGGRNTKLTHDTFGIKQEQLKRVVIPAGKIGIVETLDGQALEKDQVAGRLGGFQDIEDAEKKLRQEHNIDGLPDEGVRAQMAAMAVPLMELVMARQLEKHNSYQDFQLFRTNNGRMGVQHDVLPPGSYNLNPLLVKVTTVDMLNVDQSEVAVIRSAVGLPAEDISGDTFKFGSLTLPGHRGLWAIGLRTGQYALNTSIYTALRVPTNVITLSWADATTAAQALDKSLSPIQGTSKDGFTFTLELQVQVHVPADQAPHLISMVGHIEQLVNGILQPVVGSFFRNALQNRTATQFITERDTIRTEAETTIKSALAGYFVHVAGVFIQAVRYPEQIAEVLRQREIATQQKATYAQEREAQQARIEVEASRGQADAQKQLALAAVSVDIAEHAAKAAVAQAQGQATVTTTIAEADATSIRVQGEAEGAAIQAKGLAQAAGYKAQRDAIGQEQTALVAALHEIGLGNIQIVPQVVSGNNGGAIDGLTGLVSLDMLQNVQRKSGLPGNSKTADSNTEPAQTDSRPTN